MHTLTWTSAVLGIICRQYATAKTAIDELVALADDKSALQWKATNVEHGQAAQFEGAGGLIVVLPQQRCDLALDHREFRPQRLALLFPDLIRASDFVGPTRNRREPPFEPFAAQTFLGQPPVAFSESRR
jgi:hypothetical protein